jgi:lysophospholipase L1-like esterase
MQHWKNRLTATGLAALTLTGAAACAEAGTAADKTEWVPGWAVPVQRPSEGFEPNWATEGFNDQTVRQVVRVTTGGESARITLSNLYGDAPVRVAKATIARTEDGAAVDGDTMRALTFDGKTAAEIPAGEKTTSDAVDLHVKALESVTVTLYLADETGPATFHAQGYASSYRAEGDHADDAAAEKFTESTHSWYYLSDVEFETDDTDHATVVAYGDSITDGYGSTNDANSRWPDLLAERVVDAGKPLSVVNSGIGGNMLRSDSQWYGDSAVSRFERDVLDRRGVSSVIILCGLNDIGFSEVEIPTYEPNPETSVEQMIESHTQLIEQAHKAGIKVIGATLLPMKGAEYYTKTSAAKIRELNDWIRSEADYDAVVDFNAELADPADAEALNPAYDSGDNKHPNDKGYAVMAELIDLATL